MFNFSAFTPPNQNTPIKHPSSKPPLQNVSPAYFPGSKTAWESPSQPSQLHHTPQSNQQHDDISYDVRVLLENEQEISSTSSDSEETDTMPEVSSHFTNNAIKEWDFGQNANGRRKSETFVPNSPGCSKIPVNPVMGAPITWGPLNNGKVSTKPIYFGPINVNSYTQADKRSYFVTIEGFNISTSKKFFKIERLCQSLQPKIPSNEVMNGRQFLYLGLWNDTAMGQNGPENIFEPFVYAMPNLNFRMVVTVNMSHAYEDPFNFDFIVDLRQYAFPTRDKRTQSLEVVYAEPGSNGSLGNNTTLHLQLTNEKILVPHGFRNIHEQQQSGGWGPSLEYSVIFRQILIGVPLCRPENPHSFLSPSTAQASQKVHDPYGKRGSAISLGQERRKSMLENCPQSPMSWSNFTPDMSPSSNKKLKHLQNMQEDPIMPPGIPTSNMPASIEHINYQSSQPLYRFKGQQRFSIQPIKREAEEVSAQRTNRIQSSDLSAILGGDKSPLKILEAYVNAFNQSRRRVSNISENSLLGRFQHNGSLGGTENDLQSQSLSTLNASSLVESVPNIDHIEEDNPLNSNNDVIEEFRAEDYIGKMVEFVKTYQGSRVLQKHISTADKEDLDVIVNELGEKVGELLLDPYANYIIQTLMQNGSPSQRLHLLQKMAPVFIPIARDKKGTHALQAIVAQINSAEEFGLIKHIIGNSIFELSMDPRANYVIQKLINVIPPDSSQFIYQPILDAFVQVANNSFGLLVLKQLMARVEQKEALKQKVVELTCLNFEKLIQNPYGNYAIQHIMDFYPKESLPIMNKILLKIIPYASQKISSNVIEKCLAVCDSQFRRRVVEEILKNGRLGDLLKNKYGNFVTLELLATSVPSDQQKLMQEILKCANSFNGTKYKLRWLKFVQENPLKINWTGNIEEQIKEDLIKEQEAEQANQSQGASIEHLEAVKKIWREMTKEEKSETVPFQYGKTPGKKNYNNKREEPVGSWGDKS